MNAMATTSGEGLFGEFSADGNEYRITNWRTPRPWINLIANPRAGLAVSQTGSGFSWIDNSQLAALVRRALALRTADEGRLLVGPDNDLLIHAAAPFGGVQEAVEI